MILKLITITKTKKQQQQKNVTFEHHAVQLGLSSPVKTKRALASTSLCQADECYKGQNSCVWMPRTVCVTSKLGINILQVFFFHGMKAGNERFINLKYVISPPTLLGCDSGG